MSAAEALAVPPKPRPLRGFEGVNRYWDPVHDCWTVKLLPGQHVVTTGGEVLTTTLGSCVAACIRCPSTGYGGMNHFMLPDGDMHRLDSEALRYGNHAMEALINDVLRYGGQRDELEVKLFGGGAVLGMHSDVGERNARFALGYVRLEGLRLLTHDLGGRLPRKIRYRVSDGRVRLRRLRRLANDTLQRRERALLEQLQPPAGGEVELFE